MIARTVIPALLAVAALALAGCDRKSKAPAAGAPTGGGGEPPAVSQRPVIDTAKARELVAQGALVVDVREQEEWDAGHLPQARLVPVGTLADHLAELEQAAGGKDRPVVVYCASGGRAGKAKKALEAAGFTNVVNGGGFRAMAQP